MYNIYSYGHLEGGSSSRYTMYIIMYVYRRERGGELDQIPPSMDCYTQHILRGSWTKWPVYRYLECFGRGEMISIFMFTWETYRVIIIIIIFRRNCITKRKDNQIVKGTRNNFYNLTIDDKYMGFVRKNSNQS